LIYKVLGVARLVKVDASKILWSTNAKKRPRTGMAGGLLIGNPNWVKAEDEYDDTMIRANRMFWFRPPLESSQRGHTRNEK